MFSSFHLTDSLLARWLSEKILRKASIKEQRSAFLLLKAKRVCACAVSGTAGRGGCEQHCVLMGTEVCSSVGTICVLSLIFYLLVFICMCVSEWMGFPWRQKGAGFLELKWQAGLSCLKWVLGLKLQSSGGGGLLTTEHPPQSKSNSLFNPEPLLQPQGSLVCSAEYCD